MEAITKELITYRKNVKESARVNPICINGNGYKLSYIVTYVVILQYKFTQKYNKKLCFSGFLRVQSVVEHPADTQDDFRA